MNPTFTAAALTGFIGFTVECYRAAPQSARQANCFTAALLMLGAFIGRVFP
jgi:hypothetical protein